LFNRKLCYEEKTTNIFISALDKKTEEVTNNSVKNNVFSNEKNEKSVRFYYLNFTINISN
jgi:hypothetical protein